MRSNPQRSRYWASCRTRARRWEPRPSSHWRKDCGTSAGSKGRTSPSNRAVLQEIMACSHTSPANWFGFARTSILAVGTPATRAAKLATQRIPVVFTRISDPVGLGLVPALAQPGGNLTGVSLQTGDFAAKWLGLLITAVPEAKRVGVLWDPNSGCWTRTQRCTWRR